MEYVCTIQCQDLEVSWEMSSQLSILSASWLHDALGDAGCPWIQDALSCSLGQQPFLSPFCILGGRAARWEQGEGDVLLQTSFCSSGVPLVWGVHGAISTSPLASCGLNAQVPPTSQPPGRNLKCFQHLGGSYAAGTEIWEQKEGNDLCKRP